MEFGKVDDLSHIDFELPETDPRGLAVLNSRHEHDGFKVYVGAPVWTSRAWIGKIYPPGTPPKEYLSHYARAFSTIELNTTHYRIPEPETIERWRDSVPEGFRFCPKIPQEISHHRPLGTAPELVTVFAARLRLFQERLGPAFLQLPPSFGPDGLPKLAAFLRLWPADLELAVEFRHERFFADHRLRADAFALLKSADATALITDVAGRRDVLHASLTTSRLLVRFIGNGVNEMERDAARLDDWARRLREWAAKGLREVYFFIHEPEDAGVPELSAGFAERMNELCGLELRQWRPPTDTGRQLTFF